MKHIKQPNRHSCFPACVAAWLGLERVPVDWQLTESTEKEFNKIQDRIIEYLKKENTSLAFFGSDSYEIPVGNRVILGYKKGGTNHAVIARHIMRPNKKPDMGFLVEMDPANVSPQVGEVIENIDLVSFAIIYKNPK